jgi:N-acetylneuraminic acid mutarotase
MPVSRCEGLESRTLFTAPPIVASLTLINANTGAAVSGYNTFANGSVLDLDALGVNNFSVRANPAAKVGSIRFGLDGNSTYHTENIAPYDIYGDAKGVYTGKAFALGTHTITATAYSGPSATGTAGATVTVHFQVTRHNAWVNGKNLPINLAEVAGGIISHTMYIVGEGSSSTYAYDLFNNSWKTLPARPYVGDHHAAEVLNGKLYLFGGIDGGSPGKVQIYNPATNKWSLGPTMPFAAGSCSSAVIGGQVYVAGGIIGKTTTNQAAVYDPVKNTWAMIAPMPFGLNHSASTTDGKSLWIFGGRTGGNVVANGFATVEAYDPASNTWRSSDDHSSNLAPLPIGRGGMGKAVYFNGLFYIMGGETKDGPGATSNFVYNRVDIYNPLTNTYSSGARMPTARHGIFPLLFGDEIYVAGGGTHSGYSFSNVLQIYQV